MAKPRIRVAVAGATGYSGMELCALLARHPGIDLAAVCSSEKGATLSFSELHPQLAGMRGPDVQPLRIDSLIALKPDCCFLATPNEASAELAPKLVDAGSVVIDLAGSFRLRDAGAYPAHYGFEHPRPALLAEAVYGLTEWCGDELTRARLIANPGCYPTAVLTALKPLLPLLSKERIVVDAASGVSGAGKKAELQYAFAELSGNYKAYGVGKHRHTPEIAQALGRELTFVPHLLPAVRGMLATCHVAFARAQTAESLTAVYEQAYGASRFVRLLPAGQTPEMKNVVNTPRCDVGFVLTDGGTRAIVVSAIDNLLKGAASQAVQNMNRRFGLAEEEGLAWKS